jgi:hypothetical protein
MDATVEHSLTQESMANASVYVRKIKMASEKLEDIQLTLIVSNSVDSNFRLSQICIEVPNFVVYKYI